jgi:AbrB family looped-hinge helix DNA binding protein
MKLPEGKGVWMVKVGEKGQIVIPKEARDMFGITPGETLLLLGDLKQGLAITNAPDAAASLFSAMAEDA